MFHVVTKCSSYTLGGVVLTSSPGLWSGTYSEHQYHSIKTVKPESGMSRERSLIRGGRLREVLIIRRFRVEKLRSF